jgi:glyoxylase-like metal-dependent hydrolase (beta-lactamase superfamily II)
MRAIALHSDVLLVTSAIWQTNCAIVRSGEEAFVIDSPVLPEELDALPALIEQAAYPAPSGLLATHGDWDHLLGRLAFPGLSLGCAESTVARVGASPGQAHRELRAFDEDHLIERPRPLALGALQALPVPGRCEIGERQLELHLAPGHTDDGMAIWMPWARVLVAGDYLSAVELPLLPAAHELEEDAAGKAVAPAAGGRSLEDYLATLERIDPLVRSAAHVVPGHGPALDADRAASVLAQDRAYLYELRDRGAEAALPPGRRGRAQRERHAQNAAGIQAASGSRPRRISRSSER